MEKRNGPLASAGPTGDDSHPRSVRPNKAQRAIARPGKKHHLLLAMRHAVRMIRAGALDDYGIEALADRLGIGARHLDRLVSKHIGARPLQVARPTPFQKAKRLLDETKLPMVEIAARTGFAGLQRTNAVFRRGL